MKAVILAGGLGTRLRPLTLEIPKALIPIRGKSLTERVIEKLKEANVDKVYLSIGYMSEKIIEYFKDKDVEFLVESEPLGTGGWMHLIPKINEDFIVVNGDNLFEVNWDEMIKKHKENNALITIALTEVEDVSAYGAVELNGDKIKRFVEKPKKGEEPSNLINSGYYIFSSKVFDKIPKEKKFMLEKDLFPLIAKEGKLIGYKDKGQWFDTGTFERWDEVIKKWRVK